jgi:hypothetical protein
LLADDAKKLAKFASAEVVQDLSEAGFCWRLIGRVMTLCSN